MSQSKSTSPDHVLRAIRWRPTLDPRYFQVDERSKGDLIARAISYARLLTYYDSENQPFPPPDHDDTSRTGVWETFFAHDVTFLLAEMAGVDAVAEYRAGQEQEDALDNMIRGQLKRLGVWQNRAQTLAELAPEKSIETALARTVKQTLGNELRNAVPTPFSSALEGAERAIDLVTSPSADNYARETVHSTLNRVTGQLAASARDYLESSLTDKANHPPQTGLYLAFVHLLQKSQAHINTLTERHLRFYYQKVLRLLPAAASPDTAHVSFTLAPHLLHFELPAGTPLEAKESSEAEPAFFRTDSPLSINTARVTAFKAINITRAPTWRKGREQQNVKAIKAYPAVNSADGFGRPFLEPETGWQPFGPSGPADFASDQNRDQAEIGIAIATPFLTLTEGTRAVALHLRFSAEAGPGLAGAIASYHRLAKRWYEGLLSERGFIRLLSDAFRLSVTTATGYMPLDGVVDLAGIPDGILTLRFEIPATAPPVTAWPMNLDGPTDVPFLKLTLNPDARFYAFSAIHHLVIGGIAIDAQVLGLRSLSLHTDAGPVDWKKPFEPFGALPIPKSRLTFTHPELWHKNIGKLGLSLEWNGLPPPPEDFATYYADYGLETRNDSFCAAFEIGMGLGWLTVSETGTPPLQNPSDIRLFAPAAGGSGIAESSSWTFDFNGVPPLTDAPFDTGTPQFDPTRTAGYFRLELTQPDYGFGQIVYPNIVATTAIENGQKSLKLLPGFGKSAKTLKNLPKTPLLPKVTAISIDYEARQSTDDLGRTGAMALYQLNPFGRMLPTAGRRLVAHDYDHDGILFLGIEGLRPPETLTLLFDLHDSTVAQWSPGDGYAPPTLTWSYLSDDTWRKLPDESILQDGSHELTVKGIVKLALPADITNTNAVMPAGSYWLAITVDGDTRRYGRIRSVSTQAVTATRDLPPNPSEASARVLPAGSIERPTPDIPAIAAISQPFASFGGRAAETVRDFRIRVSERLRNKARALQPEDYPQLVLEAFPEIGEARSFRTAPGRVDLVVTPLRDGSGSPLRPSVPLTVRYQISQWLRAHASMWTEKIIVRDPNYEDIKITAHIVPTPNQGPNVVGRLEAEIARVIAPWLFDATAPMPIGTASVNLPQIAALMEELPYVQKFLGLSLVQIYSVRSGANDALRFRLRDTARAIPRDSFVDKIDVTGAGAVLKAATPWSVFVPAANHNISYLNDRRGVGDLAVERDLIAADPKMIAAYEADNTLIPMIPLRAGIGNLAIGRDLVVTSPEDARPLTSRVQRRRGLPVKMFTATLDN